MKLYVSALVDPMASGVQTQEEEYADIKKWLELVTGRAVVLKTDVQPWRLERCDLYVFDYGGMMPGCESIVDDLFRQFMYAKVAEMPSTIFVVWSSYSGMMYKELVRAERPELADAANVVVGADNDKILELLC